MYNKIFAKILDSSVWLEPTPTRIVWITLLAAMDENGFCSFAAVGNVAARARVTLEEAKSALQILEAPDPESSDPTNDGRRVERVPGGWIVLNATKYREIVTRANAQEKTNERVRRFREKKRSCNACETLGNGFVTPSEAYTEAEEKLLEANAQKMSNEMAVREVFAYYCAPDRMNRNPVVYSLTPLRLQKGVARFEDALKKTRGDHRKAIELMMAVVDEVYFNDFLMGRDSKSNGKKYCDWENNLFRSTEQFEQRLQQSHDNALMEAKRG
jgi:hypothetical protein